MIFFFFQAEDGIRDHCVTGVQTCALPICFTSDGSTVNISEFTFDMQNEIVENYNVAVKEYTKIGRASCRERV